MAGEKSQTSIKFVLMSNRASVPKRNPPSSTGLDLCSAVDLTIPPHSRALVSTQLKVQVPDNCYARIAPRSGLSLYHCIDVGAGTVDRNFKGELQICLINNGNVPFNVEQGDRVAQLIIEVCLFSDVEIVFELDNLDSSDRGTKCFGSTGLK